MSENYTISELTALVNKLFERVEALENGKAKKSAGPDKTESDILKVLAKHKAIKLPAYVIADAIGEPDRHLSNKLNGMAEAGLILKHKSDGKTPTFQHKPEITAGGGVQISMFKDPKPMVDNEDF